MLSRGYIIGKIIDDLSLLRYQIEFRNKLNQFNLTKICEDFFKEVLNIVFGYNLINLNAERANSAGIDLGDKTEKVAFQITSEITSQKVKDTLNIISDEQLQNYEKIYVLMINKKQKTYSIEQDTPNRITFSADKNILDLYDLTKEIAVLEINELFLLNELFSKEFQKVKIEFEPVNENGEFPSSLYNRLEEKPSSKPLNACKLQEYVPFDKEFNLISIHKLYTKLSNLSRHSREFISIITERGEDLSINTKTLSNWLHISEKELDNEMCVLEEQGLIKIEEEDLDYDRKTFHFTIKGETLRNILYWAIENNIPIRLMMSKLDFTIMDN